MQQEAIDRLRRQIKECKSCSLFKAGVKVPGTGSLNPVLMIVGEAPGRSEIKSGVPFSGPTREIIDQILFKLKLRPDEVWLTNVVKCPTRKFRDPYDSEIQTCGSRFLKQEIEILKPKKILALGKTAAFFFTGSQLPVKELRGKIRYYKGIPVVLTYHPAAVKRFPFLEAHFEKDLELLKEKEDSIPDWSELIHKALREKK